MLKQGFISIGVNDFKPSFYVTRERRAFFIGGNNGKVC